MRKEKVSDPLLLTEMFTRPKKCLVRIAQSHEFGKDVMFARFDIHPHCDHEASVSYMWETLIYSPTTIMRFFEVLAVAALALTAAAKKSTNAFDVYHKKSSPISLTEQSYDELTSSPRDYHSAVILTALDAKYGCEICQKFSPEWDILAKSWQKGDKKGQHRVLFGTLDFDQGRNVFIKVGSHE